ncbi:hypothetical protein TUMSATVNIG1_59510 (plasmid) [Vibrio nigripulchritudo]|nr:hypothetical protein VNTUMSATTG_59020 [Vibrio nigripulchritudo]BDU35342.1 hypothetical protein TUMSATVNIG1_59510 [Vibrio nigripulchritudo]
MTEQEFENLMNTHSVVADGWNSSTNNDVTVIGNEKGTPVAIRYMSSETDGEFHYLRLDVPVTIDQ